MVILSLAAADAQPAVRRFPRRVELSKQVEHAAEHVRGNTPTGVRDPKDGIVPLPFDGDPDGVP